MRDRKRICRLVVLLKHGEGVWASKDGAKFLFRVVQSAGDNVELALHLARLGKIVLVVRREGSTWRSFVRPPLDSVCVFFLCDDREEAFAVEGWRQNRFARLWVRAVAHDLGGDSADSVELRFDMPVIGPLSVTLGLKGNRAKTVIAAPEDVHLVRTTVVDRARCHVPGPA